MHRANFTRGVYMGKLCFKFEEVGQMTFVNARGVAFEGAIEAQNAPSGGLWASLGHAGLAGVLQKGLGA